MTNKETKSEAKRGGDPNFEKKQKQREVKIREGERESEAKKEELILT